VVAAAALAAGGLAVLDPVLGASTCRNVVQAVVPSPDGSREAIVFERSCRLTGSRMAECGHSRGVLRRKAGDCGSWRAGTARRRDRSTGSSPGREEHSGAIPPHATGGLTLRRGWDSRPGLLRPTVRVP
jgi:hypothetical protein